jgi:hypothetical protein
MNSAGNMGLNVNGLFAQIENEQVAVVKTVGEFGGFEQQWQHRRSVGSEQLMIIDEGVRLRIGNAFIIHYPGSFLYRGG